MRTIEFPLSRYVVASRSHGGWCSSAIFISTPLHVGLLARLVSRRKKARGRVNAMRVSAQRTVHVLHNSEQPASVFALLESGSKVVPLIADGLFDLLMMKMTNIYTSKKQTKIESKGPRFEIGDFCVKLGSVTMSQNFKGVLVENRMNEIYQPMDTIQQYLEHFGQYRKATGVI
ncbi:mediator of RNA polymerase II transcription subunit 20 isoform X3 [Solenopsis invicta]|uniref:mediator of RNA polymerase II transcription subunit 20 isoform X3 n=1 Tax=Solenopsis invicta TaxID=13686 RepID=UPI00193C898F|nr:mediator of RNA polymerase II transcription subunit 20 isoform X3 [Solenopsis invicta]